MRTSVNRRRSTVGDGGMVVSGKLCCVAVGVAMDLVPRKLVELLEVS
jgi:hypothetical protein